MDIFQAISDGLHDEDLDAIIKACRARAQSVPLKVGDKIRVSDEVHPQYWRGVLCTITSTEVKRFRGVYQTLYSCKPDAEDSKTLHQLSGSKMAAYDFSTGTYKFRGMRLTRDVMLKAE